MLNKFIEKVLEEPVGFFGAMALVVPILVAFDLLDEKPGGAITAFLVAVGAWLARKKVTPNKKVIKVVNETVSDVVNIRDVAHLKDEVTESVIKSKLKKAGFTSKEIANH